MSPCKTILIRLDISLIAIWLLVQMFCIMIFFNDPVQDNITVHTLIWIPNLTVSISSSKAKQNPPKN